MSDERPLAPHEHGTLLRVLETASFAGAAQLRAQVQHTRVVGGTPMLLDLEVSESPPASECQDGPIPVRALVEAPDGAPEGEVLVWVNDGYLSGLEFAWVTDEKPAGIPPADRSDYFGEYFRLADPAGWELEVKANVKDEDGSPYEPGFAEWPVLAYESGATTSESRLNGIDLVVLLREEWL